MKESMKESPEQHSASSPKINNNSSLHRSKRKLSINMENSEPEAPVTKTQKTERS